MNEEEIIKFIKENQDKLPLSYSEIVVRKHEKTIIEKKKMIQVNMHSDKFYDIYKPNKPTSRF